ncbi:uncharacterized protein [Spinacia oleracea]|uniref:Integrase catalytic domain-containing protein n=1 Tax=Spinacia oleracea TaxID=3562 RepID=A0ABM3QX69_SPIOL|nr:uncharacterized protein LOC130462977 [Spinacia oleracea]
MEHCYSDCISKIPTYKISTYKISTTKVIISVLSSSRHTKNNSIRYDITLHTSTPRYPQANGQAESSNKIIINNLNKRLDDAKGRWADELPMILWPDRTTPKTATNHTPFSLVFGCEAVIPPEVELPTARSSFMAPGMNDSVLAHDIVTVDELREAALVRMASYQQAIPSSYNKNKVEKFRVYNEASMEEIAENVNYNLDS